MKKMLLLTLIPMLITGCMNISGPVSAQQQLGFDLLSTIKQNKAEQFKELFAERLVRQMIESGVDQGFRNYSQIFYDRYGVFSIDDFSFNYQGSDTKGRLYFFYKKERQGEKNIIRERGKWVFDEL